MPWFVSFRGKADSIATSPSVVMDCGNAVRKPPAMKRALFQPTARQTNWLLAIGLLSLGQALYLRYMALENNTVSLACQAGLRTWLGDTFRPAVVRFNHNVFGRGARAARVAK